MRPVAGFTCWYRSVALGVLVAIGLGVVIAGCGGGSEVSVVPGATTTEVGVIADPSESTTTLEVASTTTEAPMDIITVGEVDGAEEVVDMGSGRATACGIIREVWMDGNTRRLKIDYVDFLTGDNAVTAAIADGVISSGDFIEYYARNVSSELRAFSVSDSVVITTYSRESPMDVSDPPCSWEEFYGLWNSVGPPAPGDFGLSDGLWWIERDETGILEIEQQWVP